ncbi:MAG: signal peptidase II [Chloroflexi bacterium]|nr:MAG: signal peptidase II [Chloroflexota bacterium]
MAGMRRRPGRLVALGAAALVIAADQISKDWAQANLAINQRITVIPGWLSFQRTENSGAAFSFLTGHNELFILITAALLVLVGFLILGGLAPDRLTVVALGLILGGGLSNLFDRVRLSAVVDFVRFAFWPTIFNLADLAIRAGAVVVVLAVLLRQTRRGHLDRPVR